MRFLSHISRIVSRFAIVKRVGGRNRPSEVGEGGRRVKLRASARSGSDDRRWSDL